MKNEANRKQNGKNKWKKESKRGISQMLINAENRVEINNNNNNNSKRERDDTCTPSIYF